MNRLKNIVIYIIFSFSLISCDRTKPELENPNPKYYLRINLKDNIKSVIPSVHSSESERFLYTQLYEALFNKNHQGKVVPQLVQTVSLDSSSNTYHFSLKKTSTFSQGDLLTTKDIYSCFKRVFDGQTKDPEITSLKRNVDGYLKYEYLNAKGMYTDSLPPGFKIIDDFNFSIRLIELDPTIFSTLSKYPFLIYKKTKDGRYFGSGAFMIEFQNADISLNLKRNPFYNSNKNVGAIEGVNIRFIKNHNALIDEFINGSIDVIVFDALADNSHKLEKMIQNKYGYKNHIEQSGAFVQYFTFNNINDKNLISLILKNLSNSFYFKSAKEMAWEFVDNSSITDSTHNNSPEFSVNDTSALVRLPIVNKTGKDYHQLINIINNTLSQYLQLEPIKQADINPNGKYIVIQEGRVENLKHIDEPNMSELPTDKETNALAVVGYTHDLIIFDERIHGFNKYGSWSQDIKNLTFSQPKRF